MQGLDIATYMLALISSIAVCPHLIRLLALISSIARLFSELLKDMRSTDISTSFALNCYVLT